MYLFIYKRALSIIDKLIMALRSLLHELNESWNSSSSYNAFDCEYLITNKTNNGPHTNIRWNKIKVLFKRTFYCSIYLKTVNVLSNFDKVHNINVLMVLAIRIIVKILLLYYCLFQSYMLYYVARLLM